MSGRPLPVFVTAAALTLAVALEVTGPPQSFLFSLRLPVLVLAAGAVWAQAGWRDVPESRRPVPMATPCLVLTSTVVVAAATVKLMSVSATLACALLSVASAACCGAVGLLVTGGRPPRAPALAAAPSR
jgi:hypothetical protein